MGSEEKRELRVSERMKRKENVGARIELRCTAIQMFLMESTSGSERRIREMFGDNPDTSKALRMLLKNNRVRRFGSGGRSDPFVYMVNFFVLFVFFWYDLDVILVRVLKFESPLVIMERTAYLVQALTPPGLNELERLKEANDTGDI